MRLEAARARAAAANEAALAAQKEHEAAEAEVEELKRVLDPKRPRTDTIEEDGPTLELDGMDLADHRREARRVMNRRAIEIGSREHGRELRTGKDGYLHHARTGLIGAVAYWALGSTALAVTMIVALIVHLKVVDKVRAALPEGKRERRERAADAIADLLEQVFELGDAGGGKGCFEKTFKLARRTWEMYKVRNRAVVQTLALALES